ncbi:hypothetical protein MPSEU_000226300 [Mayamaea pseudoterrestris]|nr:hypothetical protein MPSEU_000226300 [Mayamaea pseudoterrestris]
MAENKFLISSRARSEQLKEKHDHLRQSADDRNDFWLALRSYLSDWNDRLDRIDKEYGDKCNSLSENDKQLIQLDLTKLKDELTELKKHCLSSRSIFDHSANERQQQLPTPPESLSFGDLRLLHEELQKRQKKLDIIKLRILPKEKFVFQRYRKAVEQLRAQGKDLSQLESATFDAPSTKGQESLASAIDLHGSTIRDLDQVSIQVEKDGTMRIQSTIASENAATAVTTLNLVGAVVLRDISHSTIELHGSYPSIHMINVNNSSIHVNQFIAGAVHVTSCHHTRLSFKSQQLRLHESTNMSCYTCAATILEDCRHIHFYYETTGATPDVKDFSFLKDCIQSPNFDVHCIEVGDNVLTATVAVERVLNHTPSPCEQPNSTVTAIIESTGNSSAADDDDDEEDEL